MPIKYFKFISPVLYFALAFPVFNKIYETSKSVIDEEFHIPQGILYCNGIFHKWDPKITTFPGLYIASIAASIFNSCNVYGLRFVSLAASILNVYLIYEIRERKKVYTNELTLAIEAVTIATLPPMFFFSHLYYTDILSVTSFLMMYNYWQAKMHIKGGISAGFSVLTRQTNIVWVILLLGASFLEQLIELYAYRKGIKKKSSISLFDPKTLYKIATSWGVILQSIVNTLAVFYGYVAIVVLFIAFIIANGSIVVGDKTAHQATIHIPQIFYFSLFSLFFGWSWIFPKLKETLVDVVHSWKLYASALIVVCAVVAVNTLVHPYLLADNRHYVFYIWNRFYGKYEWFKFTMIPFYVIGLHVLQKSIAHLPRSFQVMFWVAVVVALCPQKLLEFRYFLVPFLIIRLNIKTLRRRQLLEELLFNVIINIVTLVIFLKKKILWSNYEETQRIIW